jgi:hypothetical protein
VARRKKKSSKVTFIIPKVSIETTVTAPDKTSNRKKVLGPFKLTKNSDRWNSEHSWTLMVKIGKRYQSIGGFEVTPLFSGNGLTAAISGSEIDDEEYRGFGLARRSYQLLANFYGSLESDPGGITSEDAARVWKALKAKKLPHKRFRIEAEKRK